MFLDQIPGAYELDARGVELTLDERLDERHATRRRLEQKHRIGFLILYPLHEGREFRVGQRNPRAPDDGTTRRGERGLERLLGIETGRVIRNERVYPLDAGRGRPFR